MSIIATNVVKVYFACTLLSLCVLSFLLAVSPTLVLCKHKYNKNLNARNFTSAQRWLVTQSVFCMIPVFAGIVLAIFMMQHPSVQGLLTSIVEWVQTIF